MVKLNNPLMGTEKPRSYITTYRYTAVKMVKLNNPLMGTEKEKLDVLDDDEKTALMLN